MTEPNVSPSTRPPSAPIDLEAFLGGRGLQAVGLISMFFSAAFFFKLAVDHGWLPPLARVLIGLVAGAALLLGGVITHQRDRGHRGNRAIVEGLLALGGALCYLSLWAAGPLFELISPLVAFIGMGAVTCVLTFLAARHHSQITALYGVLGGLITPGLLPHGEHPVILAAYLLALSAGMLSLASNPRYRFVPAVAFVGSFLYAPAFATNVNPHWTYVHVLVASSMFFLEFLVARFLLARRDGSIQPSISVSPLRT